MGLKAAPTALSSKLSTALSTAALCGLWTLVHSIKGSLARSTGQRQTIWVPTSDGSIDNTRLLNRGESTKPANSSSSLGLLSTWASSSRIPGKGEPVLARYDQLVGRRRCRLCSDQSE